MRVKLDHISDNNINIKSDFPLFGEMPKEPRVGRSFMVVGGQFGGIATSDVVEIMKIHDGWEFKTTNSMYRVTIMDED